MKTTLNLPDALINELIIETGEKSKSKLVQIALEEMLRKTKLNKFKTLRGKIDLEIDLEKFRALDMI